VSSDNTITRRNLLKNGSASFAAFATSSVLPGMAINQKTLYPAKRPEPSARKFQSEAVEAFLVEISRQIADPELAAMFTNCFPNTLDTTVEVGEFEGKPDTAVITKHILFGGRRAGMFASLGVVTGLTVWSLYGKSEEDLKPRREALRNLDALVIDLQDIGSRYYTSDAMSSH